MAAPRFLVWVCKGRMCTAQGADAVLDATAAALRARPDDDRARVVLARGGCYGMCEIGPNVVVRRYGPDEPLPSLDDDRLSLTNRPNESVYCSVRTGEAPVIIAAHLDGDVPAVPLTRGVREAACPPKSDVAAKIRALRARRAAGEPSADDVPAVPCGADDDE